MKESPSPIQQAATDAVFDVLVAAAEAAARAVVAAYPRALYDTRPDMSVARDPLQAARRIVVLADRIADAHLRYRFLIEMRIPVPDPEQESLPF